MPTSKSNHELNNNGSPAASNEQVPIQRRSSEEESASSMDSSSNSNSGTPRLLSSNADYDRIRNKTLMFFLDRLFIASKDGRQTSTLHGLSCLFGTREFTKDMRQIVGASRNGLKKFLQTYPSLFTVEGDNVYLTQLKQAGSREGRPTRDYNREAVDYFTAKLVQFGASLVPIRNLFGYRSQASQEVRHVSGKNAREFKQFLAAHTDVFEILADDHVVLKSVKRELEERGIRLQPAADLGPVGEPSGPASLAASAGGTPPAEPATGGGLAESPASATARSASAEVIDPYLNKQFALLVEECLRKMLLERPATGQFHQLPADGGQWHVTLAHLFEQISSECKNQLFMKMVRTLDDLRMFLRMHPKMFRRHRGGGLDGEPLELVRLLTVEERCEFELQSQPRIARLSLDNGGSAGSHSLIELPRRDETPENEHPRTTKQHTASVLRAAAPPFIPSSRKNSGQPLSPTGPANQTQAQLQRAETNLSATCGQVRNESKQAIRSYLMKSQQSQADNGLYAPSKQSNGGGSQVPGGEPGSANPTDDLRARTFSIVREASCIISRIMSTADAVALDCKGYNLGFNGQTTLIQLAYLPAKPDPPAPSARHPSQQQQQQQQQPQNQAPNSNNAARPKPEVSLFDLITNPELAYCLKPLLESNQITKIVHDVRNKSNALHAQFGIMLNNVFDTQVANLVIQQQDTGVPAYKSRYISVSKLCEIYGNESLIKYRNLIKTKTRRSAGGSQSARLKDVNYWRTRPLTDAMVYESTMDVYCLIGGVYQNLRARIKPEYEPLFEQLNKEGVLARIKPEEIRSVKKERKIDLEVIDLKRKLYSESTNTIVLSNREIRLLRHIDLSEEVRQKIQQCKKVARKLERLDMKATNNAQLNSQSLSDQNDDTSLAQQSLASFLTNTSDNKNSDSTDPHTEANQPDVVDDDDDEPGEPLMNSSLMFDELKDKMIESSSLLESLENDDDDLAASLGVTHRHDGHCRCNCHHKENTNAEEGKSPNVDSVPNAGGKTVSGGFPPSAASSGGSIGSSASARAQSSSSSSSQASSEPNSPQSSSPTTPSHLNDKNSTNGDDTSITLRAAAVDMAVQCDLLS